MKYTSLLQNVVSFIGLFCKRDLCLQGAGSTNRSHPRDSALSLRVLLWGGYDQQAPENYNSLLQKIVSCIGLFAKETYNFKEPTNRSHPMSLKVLKGLHHTAAHCGTQQHTAIHSNTRCNMIRRHLKILENIHFKYPSEGLVSHARGSCHVTCKKVVSHIDTL